MQLIFFKGGSENPPQQPEISPSQKASLNRIKSPPASPDDMEKAGRFIGSRDYRKAIIRLERAREKNPGSLGILRELADAYVESKDYDTAAEFEPPQ